jgi:hypothetical protein
MLMVYAMTPLTASRESPPALDRSANPSRSADRHVQDVFSTVLAEVGKQGYVSAQTLAESTPLEEAIATSWDQWFNEFSPKRYSFVAGSDSPSVRANKTQNDLRIDYQHILINAYQQGGYASPNSYLKTLSRDELATIQQVHHLADPISTESLSSEASLNLLLPPDAQVDENRDGLTAVGAAYTCRFPDSNTPASVRLAWEATTKDLSEQDRMIRVMQIGMNLFTANMHFDSEGRFIRSSQPGDADWVNPQTMSGFTYRGMASGWLDYLNRFSAQIPPDQLQRDLRFWSAFRDNLGSFGE